MIARPPAAVFLDFDGVIVASVALKVQAFLTIYENEDKAKLDQILAYQRLHGGITRRLKFRHFERQLFGRPGDDAAIEKLARAYAGIVHDAVLSCPYIAGAIEFLDAAKGRTALHVVSGTPEEELLDIVERRGLAPYFATVQGAPTSKPEAFAWILEEYGYAPEGCVAVGDATTEFDAARGLEIPFFGIVAGQEPSPFPAEVPVLPSLEKLASALGFD